MLYWVVVIKEPTKEEREKQDKIEEILFQPEIVVAKDDKMAAIKVLRKATIKDTDIDRVQVVVRPF